jgi:hypothetical protein
MTSAPVHPPGLLSHRARTRSFCCSPYGSSLRVVFAVAICTLLSAPLLAAPPSLHEANVKVMFTDTTTCEVDVAFKVSPGTATSLEHRLQLFEGTRVEVLGITGADLLRPAYPSGRTQVLELHAPPPAVNNYTVRYRVIQLPDQAYRCPLWVPTAPSDGRSLNVQIAVVLPAGAAPAGGGFPALRWAATGGVVTLGHVPAFVRVPFRGAGQAPPVAWDISRMMDLIAVVFLVVGMVAFIWRKRR